jgi:hypothetical protein
MSKINVKMFEHINSKNLADNNSMNLQEDINDWLNSNTNIRIIQMLQSCSDNYTIVSILYEQ